MIGKIDLRSALFGEGLSDTRQVVLAVASSSGASKEKEQMRTCTMQITLVPPIVSGGNTEKVKEDDSILKHDSWFVPPIKKVEVSNYFNRQSPD